ncbi:hypothetical protein BDM02DRAFT_3153796 [Thelephora ganbajun]|uniref:Uncharacterized protein n=1 Tax=Thelephora ganbajun TaxID=370292 RepID=A0ACB6ZRG2_THEGA|nr:hypothetical protein BDM02DRAFT_3153796 [Thelephora ganbajun]
MSETVIREVAKDVWIFSKPFSRFGVIPLGGRSTAIKLYDGGVWVLASTPLEAETKAKIDELGPVKFIIGPDQGHHLYLGEFKKAYPDAKLIAVEEAIQKHQGEDIKFDGSWGKDASDTKYGFEDEFFPGFHDERSCFPPQGFQDLIEADLLFNLTPKEQYSKSKKITFPILTKALNPWSYAHKRLVWSAGSDKEVMRRDVKTVAGWDFERIIPCHGDVIEKDANKAWREAYKWYLD